MSHTNSYESPFCTRYASPEMQYLFSADKKFTTWRRLWVALARAEHQLGLPVTQAQVDQLEANVENIDYDVAREREKVCRHDVMSHVYAYGVACPEAKGIIHLGATSCTKHFSGRGIAAVGIASLYHEVFYDTMKECTVIIAFLGEFHEVVAVLRRFVVETDDDVAHVCADFYFCHSVCCYLLFCYKVTIFR